MTPTPGYDAIREWCGQSPAQVRAEQQRIRALAKDAIAGRFTKKRALAALVAL